MQKEREMNVLRDHISPIIGQNHSLLAVIQEQEVIGIRPIEIIIYHEGRYANHFWKSKSENGKREPMPEFVSRALEDLSRVSEQALNKLLSLGYSVSSENETVQSIDDERFCVSFRCSRVPVNAPQEQTQTSNPEPKSVDRGPLFEINQLDV